jgi:peptide/nickel transport system ATP-binding protein
MRPERPLLEVRELTVEYTTAAGPVRAVDGVSFSVGRGEVFGLAGESGSGKSTIAHAMLRLLPSAAAVTGGEVLFESADVLSMDESALRAFRWREASLVLQSALSALNPVMTVGDQIVEVLRAHLDLSRAAARDRAGALLDRVGIDPARLGSYPHQLSGGMRQRVVIALALSLDPPLLILDEPTTALDVIVQREVLRHIARLQAERGFSVLFITHDLGVLAQFATRIGVVYAGELVELSPAADLVHSARHPYTQALIASLPALGGPRAPLGGIPGSPPDLASPPGGCRFHPRCLKALPQCTTQSPMLEGLSPARAVACHLYS